MLDLTILVNELVKADRRRRKHPMADPLDGAEWRGLLWTLRLLDRFRAEDVGEADRTSRDRRISGEPVQCTAEP